MFFFFKQKTAYEMRISDWSSDVCSSDLVFGGSQLRPNLHVQDYADAVEMLLTAPAVKIQREVFNIGFQNMSIMDIALLVKKVVEAEMPETAPIDIVTTPTDDISSYHRSEGHTSELQSIMRI